MEAALALVAAGSSMSARSLTHRFPIERAAEAYDLITGRPRSRRSAFCSSTRTARPERSGESSRCGRRAPPPISDVVVGFVGAGNFAQSYLLPPLVEQKVALAAVATSGPVSAKTVARKFGFGFAATDPAEVLDDERVNAVFVATRHDSHAHYATAALARGKHVFVEKPLALTHGGARRRARRA